MKRRSLLRVLGVAALLWSAGADGTLGQSNSAGADGTLGPSNSTGADGTLGPSDVASDEAQAGFLVPPDVIAREKAIFVGLDKVTAETTHFTVDVGETVQFGALLLRPRVCLDRAKTEAPYTGAYVEIEQVTIKGKVRALFSGWLIAQAPNVSEIEHAVYDIWLKDCA